MNEGVFLVLSWLQPVTRRFFRWLKGLKRSRGGRESHRGEAGQGERERERGGGECSKRGYRKIDYENRFEELEEKELSKRFLSSFCIREINRGKKNRKAISML